MKIATIVKQVPEAEARVAAVGGALDATGITTVLDGMDEYGVELALRLREGGAEAEIVAIGYGPYGSGEAVRTALALGADSGILAEGLESFDALSVALGLATILRRLEPDLVVVGGKQTDWDSCALGPAIAAALGWPHVDWVTSFKLDGSRFEAAHDADDASETVIGCLPVVVTTQQGLNEPRYPSLPSIMKAGRKPLEHVAVEASTPRVSVRAYSPVDHRRRGVMLEGEASTVAEELARRLRDEAKVR